MIEALKKDMESMHKSMKKQSKRISSLESDNKRLKKNLLMGGYESSTSTKSNKSSLLAPKVSTTVATDIEVSDAEHDTESKDDDDSKIKEHLKRDKSPKPIARRNKPKPKRQAKDIKFTFDLAHNKIKAGDNGQAAQKPKVYGGTIRFGRFLNFKTNNVDNIASYRITFDTRSIGQNSSLALGFATTSFNNWVGSNFGQNNSCMIKGNGQVLLTDKVYTLLENKEYKHKQNAVSLISDPKTGFFTQGHDVTVEVDLKNLIGRVWNNTNNIDGVDKDKIFEIMLPGDYEICIAAYMGGGAKKKLFVKDQKFVFDEEA
eukprot:745081_1